MTTTEPNAGAAACPPRKRTAPSGTRRIHTRSPLLWAKPPAGIRPRKRIAIPRAAIAATSGPRRRVLRNMSSDVVNARIWMKASAAVTSRAKAMSVTPIATATAMNTNTVATAVRFRMRRSGSSAGSEPISRTRANITALIQARAIQAEMHRLPGLVVSVWCCDSTRLEFPRGRQILRKLGLGPVSCGALRQGHGVAEGGEALGMVAGEAVRVQPLEVVAAEFAIRLAVPQDVVGDDEGAVGDGNDGLLVAAALDEPAVLGGEVGRAFTGSGAGAVAQGLAQGAVGEAGAAAGPLARALMVDRADAGPGERIARRRGPRACGAGAAWPGRAAAPVPARPQ